MSCRSMKHSSLRRKSHVPASPMVDYLLITYFIFVLKDEAIHFYTQLVGGQVPWRRSADEDRQLSDTESSAKPTSWSEMKTAFEASYLSADALARSIEQIVTLTQGSNESVTSYVNRLRDSFNNLNRQVQKQHIQLVEALRVGIFLRGSKNFRTATHWAILLWASLSSGPRADHWTMSRLGTK